jgi:hypothetical protein
MREDARTLLPDPYSWTTFENAWTQRHAVATLCRIPHTFDQGWVSSKKAAMLWAKAHAGPSRSDLIQHAVDDRRLGWDPHAAPCPGSVERTLAFLEYVQRRVGVDPGVAR